MGSLIYTTILATQKAEAGRSKMQGQPGQLVKNLSQTRV